MSQARTLVVLPTYNERENLEGVVAGIRGLGCDVLIVDDSSPDGTGLVADTLAAADPRLKVLHRPHKMGLGTAYVAGFRRGLADGYDLLVEMDADGSHLPQHLPELVAAAQAGGGLAIGSRYVPGGAIRGWGTRRLVLSRGANLYCRAVLGIPVQDCTSGFRCFTREVLENIGLGSVFSEGYSFQIEMAFRCWKLGCAITEVPITFEDRVAGKSKVSEAEVRRAFLSVVRLRLRPPRPAAARNPALPRLFR